MASTWFQFDPNRLPDSEFERGEVRHLCVGNEGRLLDFRRTPVRIERLCHDSGLATIRILTFEDKGALWDLPYEEIGQYQFKKGSTRVSNEELGRIQAAITRWDRQVEIAPDPSCREQTLQLVAEERKRASSWLSRHSQFLASGHRLPEGEPEGSPLLFRDIQTYLTERGLIDLEALFTRQYVSAMNNESVKAHRIAIAELGLAPYQGKILRDPMQTMGAVSLDRRKTHVIVRMGVVQAMFESSGRDRIILYRMESSEGPLRPRRFSSTLISASFRMDIVQEMSGWADPKRTVALYRQAVPIERALMTYLETEAMNHPFREAEAVLFTDSTNLTF
jgi:hypothetical protein